MDICFITDEKYSMPTCVAITSLKYNKKHDCQVNVYLICDEVKDDTKDLFLALSDKNFIVKLIEIDVSPYDNLAQELKNRMASGVSRSSLIKLDLPNVFCELDKLLYLDGDVIINGELSELWEIDIEDYYIAAVDDMGDGRFNKQSTPELAKRIGMETVEYFNSGVMLLNLKRLREEGVSDKMWEYRRNGLNYFMDQDALNITMSMKRYSLPYKYNFRAALLYEMSMDEINNAFFCNPYRSFRSCLEDQSIVHMTSSYKPWDYVIPYLTDLFDEYYFKSPFFGKKLERTDMLSDFYKRINEMTETILYLSDQYEYLKKCKSIMQWRFPIEKIEAGKKIIIYGAGEVGSSFVKHISHSGYCKLALWVDSNYNDRGEFVSSPEEIQNTEYDYILIALSRERDISMVKEKLYDMGIMTDKIISL